MHIDLAAVNWAAVAVAAVAAFLLGGTWYSAIFGKLWIRLSGYTPEKVAEMKAKMSPVKFLGGMLLSYGFVAVAVSFLVVALNLRGAAAGACLGSILWMGPAGAITFTGHLASDRHRGLFFIDAAFQFVALVTQGIILAAWR
jgi:Protein of unknown function (DUF1761)